MKLHISIKPETLFHISGFPITNSFLLSLVVLIFFVLLGLNYQSNIGRTQKNTLFYLTHFALKSIYDLFSSIVGSDKIRHFFTLLGAFFLFILLQNWFGLLPGVGSILIDVHEHGHTAHLPLLRAATADLNTTLMLAMITVTAVQYYGVKYLGVMGYVGKFISFKSPLAFFLGILEIVSEVSRLISYSFRLFGNIFAGEVLLLVISFLVPWLASAPFLFLEVFVGLIQALVFAMLSAVFINLAISKHH